MAKVINSFVQGSLRVSFPVNRTRINVDTDLLIASGRRPAAALPNPHIVQVHGFLESNEELLIVVEYIEGRCLSRMIGQEVDPIPC